MDKEETYYVLYPSDGLNMCGFMDIPYSTDEETVRAYQKAFKVKGDIIKMDESSFKEICQNAPKEVSFEELEDDGIIPLTSSESEYVSQVYDQTISEVEHSIRDLKSRLKLFGSPDSKRLVKELNRFLKSPPTKGIVNGLYDLDEKDIACDSFLTIMSKIDREKFLGYIYSMKKK